jgi:hypothetical protein
MIRLIKLLLAAATVSGLVYLALRQREVAAGTALARNRMDEPLPEREPEPVLGYDGMDLQTVTEWLERAELDELSLRSIRAYEQRHRARETVLGVIDEKLGE